MTISQFHDAQSSEFKEVCERLRSVIDQALPDAESKIWHRHPVWFLNENPIVGYGSLKGCIRLMFWSGADFHEPNLKSGTGKFKDASVRYTDASQIDVEAVTRWLGKAREIQWDYKNIYKRKGRLERLV